MARKSVRRSTRAGKPTPRQSRSPREQAATQEPSPQPAKGAELMWLDPGVILWPEVRITSQYRAEEEDALAKSIESIGQQQPIGVYLVEGQYVGSDGMNRCLRAIDQGHASVLCTVRQGTAADVLKSNIATALLRGHTNPLTVVNTLWKSFHEEGIDIADLAASAGRSVQWVEGMLLIATAAPAVKQALGDELIAQAHAEALAALEEHSEQEEALRLVLFHHWTVGVLEDHLAGRTRQEEDDALPPRKEKERQPRACTVCRQVQEVGGVQSLLVCGACMGRLGDTAGAPADRRLAEAVRGALGELREVEAVLASSQGTVGLAERIGRLVELMEEGEA